MQDNPNLSTRVVWINARFLGRTLTGVERVATELLAAASRHILDSHGTFTRRGVRYALRLIAPTAYDGDSPWSNIPLETGGRFKGHLWEQIDLPRLTRQGLLISLCNTGPVLKRNHLVYLHDAQPFAIPKNFSLGFRSWYRVMFYLLVRRARHIFVNSDFTQNELARYVDLDLNKVTRLYLAADLDTPSDNADCLADMNVPSKPFVLAVSSANPNKNFAGVLKALDHLGSDSPPVVFVGARHHDHFSGTEIDWGKTTHLGYVTDQQLNALYRRALCLVFPSFYEGFGLPPLEAITAGCPVIVSKTSSLPEISADAALYCDPNDPTTIADCVHQLASNDELRAAQIQKGLARSALFSWRASANTLIETIARTDSDYRAGVRSPLPESIRIPSD
ncbi:MAG: glycosyltransferase family 1 protein [Pseudomonadota bacterium]